jgi:DNA (cytosine-5)-methyltransferase 1
LPGLRWSRIEISFRPDLDLDTRSGYVGLAGYVRAMGTSNRKSSRPKIRVLDLFSGAGGLSEGFSQASDRFQTVRAVESNLAAAATYAENHGNDVVFPGQVENWLKNEDVPDADIVIGGPPCQGFSALGKQNVLDKRNQLWLRYADTIRKAEPQYFILENVPAFLRSDQFRRFKRQCQPSDRLRDYTFRAEILNAANFGAAQLRKRVILVGHHRDLPFPGFPPATCSRDTRLNVKDVLAGLAESVTRIDLPDLWTERWDQEFPGVFQTSDLHLTRHYESRSLHRFPHIPSGGNRFDIPDDLLPPCWKKHKTGSGDVMGRLRWDEPSVTIRTEFFKPEKGRYLHPTEHRALTHHEAARIQGFPDSYRWVGSKSSIARQIGNAVPIPLGKSIGQHLLTQF